MIVLGISCFYHDAAACILKDGKIVAAAAEERFSRIKHDNGFPKQAIEFCLNSLRIAANEIDIVVFYEKSIIKFERILHQHLQHFPKSRKTFVDTMAPWITKKLQIKQLLKDEFHYHGKVQFLSHHLSHAAASYYLSGFKKAVIVTMDGVGEWATTTIGAGKGTSIKIDKEIRFPHSLGLLYSAITAYLGFKVNNDEFKVMGLAPYGNFKKFMPQIDKLLKTFKDGSFALNMKYFDYTWSDHMPSKKMEKLFNCPIRKPESKIYKHHKDIAAALQEKLEKTAFNLLKSAHKKYRINNLCLSGGVALNSVMNGKILKNTAFKKIYIPPAPGDAGGALGAALYIHKNFPRSVFCGKRPLALADSFSPYLGPDFTRIEVEKVLKKYPKKYKLKNKLKYTWFRDSKKLLDKVSDLLIKQKIIAWFQGRMEWGPRALGNRSILASAARVEMKDVLNKKVKHRESFRPFAPVILKKYVHQYFKIDKNLSPSCKYMLMVYPLTEKGKKQAPAITHVDGSGRLQVIEKKDNPMYYDLIETYRKKTGAPIIINTSFNVRGEPIVCTPEDAVKCFLGTGVDYLVIGQFLVRK